MGESKDLGVMLGDPRRAVLSMAGPLVISYLIIEANTFMDLSWCSGLGDACTSALTAIAPATWIATGLGTGMGVGASAAISATLARGERERSNSIAGQTLIITVILALLSSIILFAFIDPLVDLMGVGDLRAECHQYIEPMIIGAVFIILNGMVAGMLRAEGAARKSTVVLMSSALLNMVLDPVFIYGLGLGLTGASLATVTAMGAGAAIGFSWYIRGRMVVKIQLRGFRPKPDEMMLVLGVGIPRAVEILLIAVLSMAQRIFFIQCGGSQGAMLYNLPWHFVSLIESVALALGAALIPISSAALATGNLRKSEDAYGYAMRTAIIVMTAIAVAVFVLADFAVMAFTYSDSMAQYKDQLVHIVRIYMLIVPCTSIIDVSSSMLQSMRHANLSMVSGLLRNVVVLLALWWTSTIGLDWMFWSLVFCEIFGAALGWGLARWKIGERRRALVSAESSV